MRVFWFGPIVLLALGCEPGTETSIAQDRERPDETATPSATPDDGDSSAAKGESTSTLTVTPGASAEPLREGVIRPGHTFEALAEAPSTVSEPLVVMGSIDVRTVDADLDPSEMAHGGAFQLEPRVVFLDAGMVTPSLHRDAPDAVLDVVATEDGVAAAGLTIDASLASPRWSSPRPASCTTDGSGRCALVWTLDVSDFEALSAVELASATFDVAGVVIETSGEVPSFAVHPAPSPLVVTRPGIGLQLPTVPLAAGDTVSVPVYVETTGTTPAAYDLRVEFDPAAVEVVTVTGGACTGFAAPVHNGPVPGGGGLANTTGELLMNAISPNASDVCVTDERVHVATIELRLKGDAPVGPQTIGCRVRDLFDNNFWKLAHDKSCDLADIAMGGPTGVLLVE